MTFSHLMSRWQMPSLFRARPKRVSSRPAWDPACSSGVRGLCGVPVERREGAEELTHEVAHHRVWQRAVALDELEELAARHQIDHKADLLGRPHHLAQAQHVSPLLGSQPQGGRPKRRDLGGQHLERLVIVVERLEVDALERARVAAAEPLAAPHLAERTLTELTGQVVPRGEADGRDVYPNRVIDNVLQHAIGLHALEAAELGPRGEVDERPTLWPGSRRLRVALAMFAR